MRGNGSQESKLKCLKPLLENLDEVEGLINKILEIKKLSAENIFIFQSRAMGTCKPTSDFDTYVALSPKHADLIEEKGVILYEGKHPNSFTGAWHSISLKPTDPWALDHEWPHKILHDMDAPKFYQTPPSIPTDIIERLDKLNIHINYGVYHIPPRKIEYTTNDYYISYNELRKLKESLQ